MKLWEINAGLNRIAEGDERAFERLYEGLKAVFIHLLILI